MGSVVAYRCAACGFATERLSVGWGKAGRARFWGGLALCTECKDLMVVNLAEPRAERRDRRCARCNTALKLLEGTADRIACPRCGQPLRHTILGSWD
jgi:DNA-directed RNA polymerase subunit RPC12/RpoP